MTNIKISYIIKPLFLVIILIFLLQPRHVKAGEFDNAYTFYTRHSDGSEPAYLNKNDGYVYFCSWGSKSTTDTKYRTVGYTITIEAAGLSDSIEVKLGGSIVKNVSSVTKKDVTYVLRKAKLSRLQELFFGNSGITWNQIFRKTNTYRFDAIMTVVEGGRELCGSVTENSNKRRLSAEREAYMYRTLSGIKSARAWKNANDLTNFYGRKVRMPPVSPLKVDPVNIRGNNIYYKDGKWYVKRNSVFSLGINSRFYDPESAGSRYHPNYNVYRFSGWGDNQKYYVTQGLGGDDRGKMGVLLYGSTDNKPVMHKGIDYGATTTFATSPLYFTSCVEYYMTAPEGQTVYVVPEGRVYYNNLYPANDNNDSNLCDIKSNEDDVLTLVSDSEAPSITCPRYISGFDGSNCAFPVSVSDNNSGIKGVKVFRSDGAVLFEKDMSSYKSHYSVSSDFRINIRAGESYRVYAVDNVGNERYSDWIGVSVPKAHKVSASISGGFNSYNNSIIEVEVSGGNSEINALVIMSEEENNASGERLVLTNNRVEAGTMERGLYKYSYRVDVMDQIRNLPDGKYIFDVLSGGRYEASEPVSLVMIKDVTPPVMKCTGYTKEKCGWFRGYASVHVSACDNLSGLQAFECICNNETVEGRRTYDSVNRKESVSFVIKTEGENKVALSSVDCAGNRSSYTEIIKIDASAPDYTLYGGLEGIDVNDGRWIGRKHLDGGIILRDRYSGFVAAKRYNPLFISDFSVMSVFPEQNYDVIQTEYDSAVLKLSQYYKDNVKTSRNMLVIDVKDRVGNRLNKKLYLNIDCDAPALTYPANNPWNKSTCTGNIEISDIHSGISRVQVKRDDVICGSYSFDASGNEQIYLDLSEYAGVTDSVSVIATDMVGNSAEYFLDCDNSKNREQILRSIRTRLR
ncbi:MAG: hypothetical protein HFH14_10445 [Lachnospiraceae bacterium]|nr:hypothetical protein [Lachnospiraceae bacterium]